MIQALLLSVAMDMHCVRTLEDAAAGKTSYRVVGRVCLEEATLEEKAATGERGSFKSRQEDLIYAGGTYYIASYAMRRSSDEHWRIVMRHARALLKLPNHAPYYIKNQVEFTLRDIQHFDP